MARNLKKYNLTRFIPNQFPFGLEVYEIYNFLSPYHENLVKIDQAVLEKKMLMHDGQRTTHSNRPAE